MLIGEYEGKVTEKNRVAVPTKVRNELEKGLILSRGYEGCLILPDEDRWKKLIDLVSKRPLLNLSIRDTKRFLIGGAHELELDHQGRFVMPARLKTYAHIKTEIVFVAIMDWVEIWAGETWTTKLKQLNESAGDIAEKLLADYDKT